MQFIIVEEDRLVAEDLKEILQVSFGDAQVAFYSSIADLEARRRFVAPNVLLASASIARMQNSPFIQELSRDGTAIVLLDSWEDSDGSLPEDWTTVESPFSEESLRDAVRNALQSRAAA